MPRLIIKINPFLEYPIVGDRNLERAGDGISGIRFLCGRSELFIGAGHYLQND